jgi:hypothetical protein
MCAGHISLPSIAINAIMGMWKIVALPNKARNYLHHRLMRDNGGGSLQPGIFELHWIPMSAPEVGFLHKVTEKWLNSHLFEKPAILEQ